ncbi:MAG: dephospho-CoA kinase [Planctomycetota bacterium]
MLVIGVAGGVASGKSLVTRCLEHFGACVLDADKLGHEVLLQTEVIGLIVDRWGSGILVDNMIDRKRLAEIVFATGPSGQQELEALEAITHPRIGQLVRERIQAFRDNRQCQATVLDAPVMFKAGWDQVCDEILFVDAPLDVRQQRAASRGWDEDELTKRESRQIAVSVKKNLSTGIIDNSGSIEETYYQVRDLWRQWNLKLPEKLESPSTLFST